MFQCTGETDTSENGSHKMPVDKDSSTLVSARAALKSALFVALSISFFINVFTLATPIYMLQVFDRVITSRSIDTLIMLSLLAIVALLTWAALDLIRNRIMAHTGYWLEQRLGGPLLRHSVYQYQDQMHHGSSHSLRDLGTVRRFISSPTLFALLDAPWAPLFMVLMFMLHPVLGWVALTGALTLFALGAVNERLTRKQLSIESDFHNQGVGFAEGICRQADSVLSMGMLPSVQERWQRLHQQKYSVQFSAERCTSVLAASSKLIRMVLQVSLLGCGAWLVIQGELSPGAMIAGSILMSRVLAPVEQSIATWRSASQALQACKRLTTVLSSLNEDRVRMSMPAPRGAMAAEGLSYRVSRDASPILQSVSFELKPGEVLGIIGPSGSGKSTLVKLLLGTLRPTSGHARLDGLDMAVWHADDRGLHCGYLSQQTELVEGTVAENISRLQTDACQQAVISAARLAGCHEMIMRLPAGYETLLGEQGVRLSGGQAQRIALARALFGTPRFVVLDEANANLDAEGEGALIDAIGQLKNAGSTVVIVGHRPVLFTHADKVLLLKGGRVDRFGPRDEVIGPPVSRPEILPVEVPDDRTVAKNHTRKEQGQHA